MGLRIDLWIEDHLDDSLPVPQFNKDQPPEVSSSLNPSEQDNLSVYILLIEIPAITCSFQISQKVDHHSWLIHWNS
jgi:hypothetical protein